MELIFILEMLKYNNILNDRLSNYITSLILIDNSIRHNIINNLLKQDLRILF
jgi:hypothetical protein